MRLEQSAETKEVYSSTDPAFGPESDWEAYRETLDSSHLEFVGTPTSYKMRSLSRQAHDEVLLEAGAKYPGEEQAEIRGLWIARCVFDRAFVGVEDDPPLGTRIELGGLAIAAGALTRPTRSR